MSLWSHQPEKLDEVTIEHLPLFWKDKVLSEKIELEGVPEEIRIKAMDEGVTDYQAGLIDQAMMILKGRKEDGKKDCYPRHSGS